jgi:hypothetical protein
VKKKEEINVFELLKKIEKIFFEAMIDRYAGRNKKSIKIKGSDGDNIISFISENFKVLDRCFITPYSKKIAGTIVILRDNIPIWFMSYSGYYPAKVNSFLKSALQQTYKKELFLGGRGPHEYSNKVFVYRNYPFSSTPRGSRFSSFSGHEAIYNKKTSESLGFCDYRGIFLR